VAECCPAPSITRYTSKASPCRCDGCRAMMREWQRRRRLHAEPVAACIECGAKTRANLCRMCSSKRGAAAAGVANKRRAAERERSRTQVVALGPVAYCMVPGAHPSRRSAERRGRRRHFFVGVECRWCGDAFLWHSIEGTLPLYCGQRCAKNASRARRGRFAVPPQVRLAIYERDGWVCQLCSEAVEPDLPPLNPWAATLDHIVCQSWQLIPDHSPSNLRLAHRWCNSVRGDETYYTPEVLSA
jgi:hypothetical protein